VIATMMQQSLATHRGLGGRGPVSALHRSVLDVAADGGQRGGGVGAALPAPSDVLATRRPIAVLPPVVVEPSDDAVPPDGITNAAVSAGSAMVHQEHAARQ
jgi:hypothetical protein